MKKIVLFASLATNAGLAGLVLLPLPAPRKDHQVEVVVQNKSENARAQQASPFTWAQLESSDFENYISNLRRVGCPEETIRDLIIADVRKLYFKRAQTLGGEYLPQLESDIRWTLDNLLGSGWQDDWLATVADADELSRLAFLPEQVATEVRKIEDAADLQLQSVSGGTAESQAERLNGIERVRLDRLRAALNEDQLAEYLRKNHPVGQEVSAMGLQWKSNHEYLQVFESWFDFDQAARVAQSDPGSSSVELRLAEQSRDDQIRNDLGEERYQEYQREFDQDYQTIEKVARRFDLPVDTSERVFQINATLDNQLTQLEAQELPQESFARERELLLAAASTQTRNLLGQEAFDFYKTGQVPESP